MAKGSGRDGQPPAGQESEPPAADEGALQDDDKEFRELLNYIKRSRGFDFTAYKRASLERRVRRRMQTLGVESFEAYTDYLEVHPQEFTILFNTVLINVTSFFRDTAAWEYVGQEILPRIVSRKDSSAQIRIWSAGCASGEEAYSVAMLLGEMLGDAEFRERVKIYATDVDEEALTHARHAAFGAREVAGMPPELLEKYFERSGSLYTFRKDYRRAVIFGRHDLVQDAPISRIDLLACRNTLMYFNMEAQAQILSRLHFALNDDGYLFLGRAEMLFTHSNLFVPVDLRRRVFGKVFGPNARERLLGMTTNGGDETNNQVTRHVRFREAMFDTGGGAQLNQRGTADDQRRIAAPHGRAESGEQLLGVDPDQPAGGSHGARP